MRITAFNIFNYFKSVNEFCEPRIQLTAVIMFKKQCCHTKTTNIFLKKTFIFAIKFHVNLL